jgi:arylsulfatase A-like enzyme
MRGQRTRSSITPAVLLVALVVSASSCADRDRESPAGGATASRPNVVFVMADDMRPDEMELVADLRPGGGFDWVRAHGTRFPKIWTTNNLCCPGRSTMLTGQTSYNHQVFLNAPYVPLENTLPTWLRDAGYCTGFAGKYMNAYTASTPRPAGWTYWEPLTARYADETGYSAMRRDGTVSKPKSFITNYLATTSQAQLADCRESGKPAFVALWPFAPHTGADPEARYRDVPVPWRASDPSFNEADISDKPAWLRATFPNQSPDAASATGTAIERRIRTLLSVDDALKSLIDYLAAQDELSSTLIILASDNGYLYFEHRSVGKALAYEAAQPALWIAGTGFPAGADSDAYATNLDVAPTIAKATGADARLGSELWDGRALQDVLKDSDLGHDRFLPLYVGDVVGVDDLRPQGDGVRTWRYKYIRYADGSEELYDLQEDPYEELNVAGDPAYGSVKADMIALLSRAKECKVLACRESAPEHLQE